MLRGLANHHQTYLALTIDGNHCQLVRWEYVNHQVAALNQAALSQLAAAAIPNPMKLLTTDRVAAFQSIFPANQFLQRQEWLIAKLPSKQNVSDLDRGSQHRAQLQLGSAAIVNAIQ